MATTPALGSLSTADLAAKVRAKFPGSYDDKPDAVLVGAWLKKYPDYSPYLTPESSAQVSALGNARAAMPKPQSSVADSALGAIAPRTVAKAGGTPGASQEGFPGF